MLQRGVGLEGTSLGQIQAPAIAGITLCDSVYKLCKLHPHLHLLLLLAQPKGFSLPVGWAGWWSHRAIAGAWERLGLSWMLN